MTHYFQRTAIVLIATSALCASPALARTHHHHHAAKKGHAAHHAAPAAGANGTIVTLPGEATSYIVKKGDTLAKIADALDTTVADLKRDNKLKGNDLQPGQELKGPSSERKAYVVAHGDTPFSIAQKLHVTVGDLRAENGLTAKAAIHSGQKLKLPAGFKAPPGLADDEAQPARGARPTPASDESGSDEGGSRAGASGRVETVPGGATSYKVRKGDTLAKIADKIGTSVAELRRDNHLKGNALSPGKRLKGPRSGGSRVYVAASGDTLSGIATRFGVSVPALKAANGLKRRVSGVRGGQRLHLPGGAHDRGREALDRATVGYPRPVEPDNSNLPSRPQPYQPNGPTPRTYAPSAGTPGLPPPVVPQASAGPTDAQVMSMGKGRFQWPLKGEIISNPGPLPDGQRNDGINIRAAMGDAVHSAADGDVVYAGDQVVGFGNLVLIQHADGWATVYAYLSRIDVKNKQKVTQGQQIGQAGQSGGVTETQVHFEVRYAPNPTERARPVDPRLVLPK